MEDVHTFVQGEGFPQMVILPHRAGITAAGVKQQLTDKYPASGVSEMLVFPEEGEEPVEDNERVPTDADGQVRVHVHRCRHVSVTVKFAGETADRRFSPATTIARIKRWAALKAFGLSEDDASEHVLQIAGTVTRPEPDTHVGTLVHCPDCAMTFDLVAIERINGATECEKR
jgi:hypothetical protein